MWIHWERPFAFGRDSGYIDRALLISSMPMKMLEYCQRILAKVSFDRHLFAKELAKSINRLEFGDVQRLRQWCLDQFGQRYEDIILNTFPPQLAV